MILGQKIRARREELGKSVKQIAEETGISPGFLYNLEVGYRAEPTFTKGMRLAEALELEPSELIPTELTEKIT